MNVNDEWGTRVPKDPLYSCYIIFFSNLNIIFWLNILSIIFENISLKSLFKIRKIFNKPTQNACTIFKRKTEFSATFDSFNFLFLLTQILSKAIFHTFNAPKFINSIWLNLKRWSKHFFITFHLRKITNRWILTKKNS